VRVPAKLRAHRDYILVTGRWVREGPMVEATGEKTEEKEEKFDDQNEYSKKTNLITETGLIYLSLKNISIKYKIKII
jgi:hypothetical protein